MLLHLVEYFIKKLSSSKIKIYSKTIHKKASNYPYLITSKISIVLHVPYHFEFLQRMKHSKQRQMQEHLGYIPSSFQPPYFALHPRFLAYLQLLRFPKIKNKTKHLFFTVIIYFHIIIIISIIIICFLLYQF